jgi:uncharacterized membrane protein
MEIFSIILFVLGLLIFIAQIFNVVRWIIPLGALIIMIVSLFMLFNILSKKKDAEKERLVERIQDLETRVSKENR